MINWINMWAKGIVMAAIIGTIIEIILPEGKNKKYIKIVIGIYILFTIIYPVINKISRKDFNLNLITIDAYKQVSTQSEKVNTNVNKCVDKTYKNNIEEDIKQQIKEKGYKVENIIAKIKTKSNENYGQIDTLEIEICKNEENITNNINVIKEIEISDQNTLISTNKVDNKAIEELKNYLSQTYYIDKTKIYINN